jgi:hypothetical protein
VTFLLHAPDQIEQRTVERQQLVQAAAQEHAAAGPEQLFRGRVDITDAQLAIDHEQAARHGVENDLIQPNLVVRC